MNEPLLFQQAKAGDKEALEKLTEANMGLVKSIAVRFRDRGTETEDLIQIGCIGLIKAIRGYDESFGTMFSTYAVPLIYGEIRKFLRDDGIIKVSRELRRKATLLCRERQRIVTETGASPHISELAATVGMSVEEAAEALEATAAVESLYGDGDDEPSPEMRLWTDNVAEFADSFALRQAVESLPEEEKMLVLLRYYRGMSQSGTAKILGITQVKVSRRERKIMEKLKTALC